MTDISLDWQNQKCQGHTDTPSLTWPCKVPASPKEGRGRKASPPALGKGHTVQGTQSGQLQPPVCSSVQGWTGLGAACSSGMCLFLPIQSILWFHSMVSPFYHSVGAIFFQALQSSLPQPPLFLTPSILTGSIIPKLSHRAQALQTQPGIPQH